MLRSLNAVNKPPNIAIVPFNRNTQRKLLKSEILKFLIVIGKIASFTCKSFARLSNSKRIASLLLVLGISNVDRLFSDLVEPVEDALTWLEVPLCLFDLQHLSSKLCVVFLKSGNSILFWKTKNPQTARFSPSTASRIPDEMNFL